MVGPDPARDWSGVADLFADEAVVERPVSGERIVGGQNFVAVTSEYPEGWSIRVLRIVADGDEVVSEVEVPHGDLACFARPRSGPSGRGGSYAAGSTGRVPEPIRAPSGGPLSSSPCEAAVDRSTARAGTRLATRDGTRLIRACRRPGPRGPVP
ncbi:nuclear transport factor 2 family protein [Streptomyces sp. NPDC020141]|uniref:nuclear transport factor 2 family protein n=1 Tax=Streptomyces sp. NPDC020141 TaxID=3365065 RepID=UPI0037AA4F8C